MAKYRIAELLMEIPSRYGLVERVCQKYRVETEASPDLTVTVTDEDLAAVRARFPDYSLAYAESFCVCREAANAAAALGVVLFHAATVEVDGKAYAFAAPSGTGKSTHIKLWRRVYGERVKIINGDKPFLREKDGVFTVYGSPWCGKEGWNRNVSAPLAGICFLSQAEENSIAPMPAERALPRVFAQMIKPPTEAGIGACLRTADLLIRNVPIYHLSCNMDPAAAELSFRTMTGTL